MIEWLAGIGAALFLVTPANFLVRWVLRISRRAPLPEDVATGRWIGGLERLLIFVLVVAGDPAAAGLVVAAKSILRFPEITNVNSRITAEYVLIGSLASWLIAFSVGTLMRALLV